MIREMASDVSMFFSQVIRSRLTPEGFAPATPWSVQCVLTTKHGERSSSGPGLRNENGDISWKGVVPRQRKSRATRNHRGRIYGIPETISFGIAGR